MKKDPRLCVGIVLVNNQKNVFVGKRHFKDSKQTDEYWQMPQGGVNPGENPFDAMLRELHEEIGVSSDEVEIIAESKHWYKYDIPEEYHTKSYCAQQQKWFLLRFKGQDEAIDLKIKPQHQEFSEWKWKASKQVAKSVIPFKKEVYKKVMKDFEWYF
ncbi:MAG: RNA pyrophosphohydrolase [Alphaproteobacteria bacterium]|nr:MAG: RNA pyrophosphohydrolase [Alphaproteobacteria bacterium]